MCTPVIAFNKKNLKKEKKTDSEQRNKLKIEKNLKNICSTEQTQNRIELTEYGV